MNNGKVAWRGNYPALVSPFTKNGEIDEKKFENKWRALMRYPGFFLEAMDINRVWFSERCANMLSVESVGNG